MDIKQETLVKLFQKHGLQYVKQIATNQYKVYDRYLDDYALVSYDYNRSTGYQIISYIPLSGLWTLS